MFLINAANNHALNVLAEEDEQTVIAQIPAGTTPARVVATPQPVPAARHELVTGKVRLQGFTGLPDQREDTLVLVSIAFAATYAAAVRAGEAPARDDLVIAGRNVIRRHDDGRTEILGCVGLTAVDLSGQPTTASIAPRERVVEIIPALDGRKVWSVNLDGEVVNERRDGDLWELARWAERKLCAATPLSWQLTKDCGLTARIPA